MLNKKGGGTLEKQNRDLIEYNLNNFLYDEYRENSEGFEWPKR